MHSSGAKITGTFQIPMKLILKNMLGCPPSTLEEK